VAGREKYKGLNEDCEPLIPTYVTSWPFISKGLGQHKTTKGIIVHLMIFHSFSLMSVSDNVFGTCSPFRLLMWSVFFIVS
jgi:hypothetical protein